MFPLELTIYILSYVLNNYTILGRKYFLQLLSVGPFLQGLRKTQVWFTNRANLSDIPQSNSWIATTWQSGRADGQYNTIFFHRICITIEFSRRGCLLFLTTNMVPATSHATQEYWQCNKKTHLPFLKQFNFHLWNSTRLS